MSDSEKDLFGDDPEINESFISEDEQELSQDQDRNLATIEVALPRYPPSFDRPTDPNASDIYSATYLARIPAFLTLDPKPFKAEQFVEEMRTETHEASADDTSNLKLRNENTVRWRYARDSAGNMAKQSNARFVQWSDGSLSLQLGSEIIDVATKPAHDTFLVVSHPENELLQSRALLDRSMKLTPASMSSQTHKKLSEMLALRQQAKTRVVGSMLTVDDPEKIQREAERAQTMALKARRKLEAKQRQLEERAGRGMRSAPLAQSRGSVDDGEDYSRTEEYGDDDDDGFVANDDEEEVVDDEDDEDDEEEDDRARSRLQDLKQSGRTLYEEGARKKRRVIDDDDEE